MADTNSGRLDYELRNIADGGDMGHMTSFFPEKSKMSPYRVGQSIPIPDAQIFRNNSKRVRRCIIEKVEEITPANIYILYLLPTKQEIRYDRQIDSKRLFEKPRADVDRDGEDGWLPL